VHGLWTSPANAWENPDGNFKSKLLKPQSGISELGIETVDYEKTNAFSFSTNDIYPNVNIKNALLALNSLGYAAAQVDVIGHSMGGLLTRIWTQEATPYSKSFYRTAANYLAGNVHKLIEIDSPNLGGFRADEILPYTTNNALALIANAAGADIISGAINDLATHSTAIINMNKASSNVVTYLLVSSWEPMVMIAASRRCW
jgi:Palmitoyl protein thioesterase